MIYFAEIDFGSFLVSNRVRSSRYDEDDSDFRRSLTLIKIGHTEVCGVNARIQALKHFTGRPVKLLAYIEGGPDEESELHRRFDNLRLPEMGRAAPEWFYPGKDLLEFIGKIPVKTS